MKLQVLGSSSQGNCYILNDCLIIEAGIKLQYVKQAFDFNFKNVIGCLVTHEHGDHAAFICDFKIVGIPIYASKGTMDAINLKKEIWNESKKDSTNDVFLSKNNLYGHNVHVLKSNELTLINDYSIFPFNVIHDVKEPLGFLIRHKDELILFATDTYHIPFKFSGLTHLIIECNYSDEKLKSNFYDKSIHAIVFDRVKKSHMSLAGLKQILSENDLSQVKGIVLIHVSKMNGEPDKFIKEVSELTGKPVYVADKNLIFNF